MPNKALQATAAELCGWKAGGKHNAVVAGASALPAAVPELGRQATRAMTSTTHKRIVILPQPEGEVVARLTGPDGEFCQIPSGEIYFTYRHGESRRWYVNKSIVAFRESATIFNRFCELHADYEDTDDDAVWSALSAQLRREFEQIEPLGDPESSLWSTTVYDTEWGLLSLY